MLAVRVVAACALAIALLACGDEKAAARLTSKENSVAACDDGRDNDLDGQADCQDPECVSFCDPTSELDCGDELDEDHDNFTDCDDADCAGASECDSAPGSEDTATRCNDLDDNDADGDIDCADADCQGVSYCGEETSEERCADDIDNDGNGAVDCADASCEQTAVCAEPGTEQNIGTCVDGEDNDGDGSIDCADPSCLVLELCGSEEGARCSDTYDNDADGLADCADSNCLASPACAPIKTEATVAECTDGTDNNNNGLIDCADAGCAAQPFCTAEDTNDACIDGFDNDGDGSLDCFDADCAVDACTGSENYDVVCTDESDNDGDGLVDCADPDCVGLAGCESEETSCADGNDNDGDGSLDCMDPDCALAAACTAETENCTTPGDDDGDGYVNCADFDCLLDFAQAACDTPVLSVRDLQDATKNDVFTAMRGDGINDPVRLRGVVVLHVEANPRLFYVADSGALKNYSAVRVYVPTTAAGFSAPEPGDVLDLAGLVTERSGETHVLAYGFAAVSAGTQPSPFVRTIADLTAALPAAEAANDWHATGAQAQVTDPDDDITTAERVEGSLVTLTSLVVTARRYAAGTTDVIGYDLAPAPLTVGAPTLALGLAWAVPQVDGDDVVLGIGQPIDSITGIVRYERKRAGSGFVRQYLVQPRSAADWVFEPLVDTDEDGLADADEELLGTDPNNFDTDFDWFSDGAEVGEVLAPSDSDGDGVIDALESFLLDKDGDNIPDEQDKNNLDGETADRDGDGIPNNEDDDIDGDGILNVDDWCLYAPTSQASWDYTSDGDENLDYFEPTGDGYGDLFENSGDACDWDKDGDFWPNPYDNCPETWNFDQADSDGDGFGDECEGDVVSAPVFCSEASVGGLSGCDIIIEEVMYNITVAGAAQADYNRDGTGDFNKDEFVELRNVLFYDTLDLSGYELYDAAGLTSGTPRHVFPQGTILRPGQSLVVFGGGTPKLFPSYVVVQTASSGALGLDNTSDTVTLYDPEYDVAVAELSYGSTSQPSASPLISISRYPQGTVWPATGSTSQAKATFKQHPIYVDPVNQKTQFASPGSAPDASE